MSTEVIYFSEQSAGFYHVRAVATVNAAGEDYVFMGLGVIAKDKVDSWHDGKPIALEVLKNALDEETAKGIAASIAANALEVGDYSERSA